MAKILMPCVILSGGRASRLGRLKQDLAFLDSTLADFMVQKFKEMFENVYFSAKFPIKNSFKVRTILDAIGGDLIANVANLSGGDLGESATNENNIDFNKKDDFAPIFGLQSILESLQCDVFVISIDAPCFDYESVQGVISAYEKSKKSTFVKNSKIHPLLGIYSLNALLIIKAQIAKKDYKLTNLLRLINAEFVSINEEKTRNLNTSKDYEEIHKILLKRI